MSTKEIKKKQIVNNHHMKKINRSNLEKSIKSLFTFFICFFFCLIWVRYISASSVAAIIIAVLLAVALTIISNYVVNKKQNRKKILNEKDEEFKNQKTSLLLNKNEFVSNFIFECVKQEKKASINKNKILLHGENFDIMLVNFISFEKFKCGDLINFFNNETTHNCKRIIFLTNEYEEECNDLLGCFDKDIEVHILNYNECYNLILHKKISEISIKSMSKSNKKLFVFKNFCAAALNKKRAKGYFFAAIFLIFTSFVVYYSIYYKIVASVLLVLAFLSHFDFKFKNNLTTEKSLLN